MVKAIGLVVGVALLAGAALVASSPWRVSGGRFMTEYLLAGGAIGVVGVAVLFFSAR